MASTFIPGLNSQNPHYIPGYTGHCPLLRFSMGQTYGQMTGQLLRSSPGLARPPSHRTLLPPIRPPRSPEGPRKSLPVRRGHERLSSSMIPGYTGMYPGMNRYPHPRTWVPHTNKSSLPPAYLGFVPQAQFLFAKNSSRVWAEALNDFTQWYGRQRSQELPKEAKGEKDVEKDQEPKLEAELETEKEPELGQEAEQVRPRRLMGSTRREWGALPLLPLIPWMTEILASSSCQALQEFGQMKSGGRSQKDPKHLPSLSRTYPQNLGLVPKYGGYVPGYKFQFGRTYGHLTHDALGLSTIQKQLLA
ncbi:ciliary microtubule inner protein 2B [Sagmatias obliquidens]|uniref:ciliary microtubule inner protein 2B n=1 Tax=Sagmatias obliquidens TaxID=3371155 RepID=UPI000F441AA9|nr:protein FAM166B [Lagenorhynchus obliquidens]